jgi:hypothetical protein
MLANARVAAAKLTISVLPDFLVQAGIAGRLTVNSVALAFAERTGADRTGADLAVYIDNLPGCVLVYALRRPSGFGRTMV